MKILLIRPRDIGNINTRLPDSLNKRQGVVPPLGIAYIAGSLEKAGHEVKILDVIAQNLSVAEVREEIRGFGPALTGVTTMTPTLFGALDAAKTAKELGSKTVLGGPQLSIYPKETVSYPYVDYGIGGEGEYAMAELAAALEKGTDPRGIKGLIYKEGDEITVNPPVIVDDLDALRFPAYHLLPMRRYDSIISLRPVSTMISTRGCPYRCRFCFKQPSDKKFRTRSPKSVVDEMECLVHDYGVKEIMFYDDTMTLKSDHITGICEEILRRELNVAWETPTRIECVNPEMLRLMRKAGCIRLRYGVESGDPEILKLMDKKIGLEQVRSVFKMTKEAGIETFAYFIIGYAHETEATIRKTIDFALEIDPDLVMFTVATPLPETPLYDLARKEGIVKDDYWREFTLGHKTGERIPYLYPDAKKWGKTAFRRFYIRPKYIMRRLMKMRTLNDIKKAFDAFKGIYRFRMEGSDK